MSKVYFGIQASSCHPNPSPGERIPIHQHQTEMGLLPAGLSREKSGGEFSMANHDLI